jgi:hypothetical protein
VQISGNLELKGTQVTGTGTVLAPKDKKFANGKTPAKVDLTGKVTGNTVELEYKGEDQGKITLGEKKQAADQACRVQGARLSHAVHGQFSAPGHRPPGVVQ